MLGGDLPKLRLAGSSNFHTLGGANSPRVGEYVRRTCRDGILGASRNNLNSGCSSARVERLDSIVPLTMELIAFEYDFCEFLVGDYNSCRVVSVIELRLDAQSLGPGGVTNQGPA